MSSESEDDVQAPSRSRRPLVWVVVAVVLVAAFLGGRELSRYARGSRTLEHTPAVSPAAEPRPAPPPAVATAPAPALPEPAAETKPRSPRKARPTPVTSAAAPAAPTTGELRIESDVPGAMVFLDRVFLGNAPATARDVAPGSHHLNVSAEGYDGYSETIDVVPGPATVTVRFKEIRLKEALNVVHRHGIGSCEGRLLADPQGIRYETPNKDDAFSVKYAEIEVFEIDYLKKNLRLKRKGGKTWNFTTKTENADPLFVFHRNVDKVRQQLLGAR